MSCKDLTQTLTQFVVKLQTEYRYSINEHIRFNKDVVNSLRISDLMQVVDELSKALENEPILTAQQVVTLMSLFPDWKNL